MLKKILILITFLLINIIAFSEKSKFLAVGNVKIVRQEPLIIKREDLNITIEKDNTIKVESFYTFENVGNYNVKSTFLFWLDSNIEKVEKEDFSNKNTNNRGRYIKNIKFFSDYKKSQNLRAVIKFDENIYKNQKNENIQREWFAISKVIEPSKEGKIFLSYDLQNTNFLQTKDFTYSFELVNNFLNKNKAEIFYVNIYNKSAKKIKNIDYKGYEFKNITKNKNNEHFELLAGNVNLDDKMVINFY
ncbi:hypothetical protein [Leptotrichia sp. oral taxon 847]|uniref:hypothetical protein n=1 Tax=Leptotrichia sp. oral taxon 847 TaxID=1785996 RepID=UPI0007680021|nr:hypothetical protein [Leptotrichia sp. oral taxon 847]AMD95364.1 hypothetical protein AXF11_07115 [Leptotrichia sp. oral taxon 847]